MHRVIEYVLDTKDMGLKLWPTGVMGEPWRMVVFTDTIVIMQAIRYQ